MDLRQYDLKREMIKCEKVNECMKDIVENTSISINLDEIFKDDDHYSIEKYLLFKIQAVLGCGFDCDKTKIVKEFFDKKSSKDTVLSLQSVWGQLMNRIFEKQSYFIENTMEYHMLNEKYKFKMGRAQKFIYELANIEQIKEKLGEELYLKFSEFAHYYHTIGNMSPCPTKWYNSHKAVCGKGYDRLDLFMKTEKFQLYRDWFCDEEGKYSKNVNDYKLEPFIELNLENPNEMIEKLDIEAMPPYLETKAMSSYLDTMICAIKKRADDLLSEKNRED